MTTIIAPRVHDLGGGFNVRRAVPSLQARSVGPFVFVDHMGPAVFEPGRGIDVRPHPHIGLATVTFLWSGAINHKDTLGSEQVIAPGDAHLTVELSRGSLVARLEHDRAHSGCLPSVDPMPLVAIESRFTVPDDAQEASYFAASARTASFWRIGFADISHAYHGNI